MYQDTATILLQKGSILVSALSPVIEGLQHCDQRDTAEELSGAHEHISSCMRVDHAEIDSVSRWSGARNGLIRDHEQRSAIAAALGGRHDLTEVRGLRSVGEGGIQTGARWLCLWSTMP